MRPLNGHQLLGFLMNRVSQVNCGELGLSLVGTVRVSVSVPRISFSSNEDNLSSPHHYVTVCLMEMALSKSLIDEEVAESSHSHVQHPCGSDERVTDSQANNRSM
jgi:hypothetical protein